MTSWEVRTVDPRDEAQLRRHWEVGHAAEARRPYDVYWSWETCLTATQTPRPDQRVILLGAYDGSTLWGAVQLMLPMVDHRKMSYAEVFVHPDRQRDGAGRALLNETVRHAREAGRTSLVIEAYVPPHGPAPALELARVTGFEAVLHEELKALDLHPHDRWAHLGAAAAPYHSDYRLVSFVDQVPDTLAEGYCRLEEAYFDEVPLDEPAAEREDWTPEKVRDREHENLLMGRRTIGTLAVESSGKVAGVSEVFIDHGAQWRANQAGTLVLPAHRGHRLGMALKVANQLAVMDAVPECRTIFTDNAGGNVAMNAINERIGFRTVERLVEVQKHF